MQNINNNNNNNKFDFVVYGNYSNPHSNKIKLMFEELSSAIGISWDFRDLDLVRKDSYTDEFINANTNKKIPALIDNTFEEPFYIYESGSVLIYLGQKYSKFLPDFKINPKENSNVTWTVWQVSNLGSGFPKELQQNRGAPSLSSTSASNNNNNQVEKILKLIDDRLSVNQYIGGKEYSIADIATAGWLLYLNYIPLFNCKRDTHQNIFKWLELINKRESVQKVSNQLKSELNSIGLLPVPRFI